MRSRMLAACLGLIALLVSETVAQAQVFDERQQMLMGGAPRSRIVQFFRPHRLRHLAHPGELLPARERPGTIVINTAERRLYLVQDDGTALRYGIGVGRVGFTWKGVHKVTAKKEWPGWTPPPQMRARRARPAARTWRAASRTRSARARMYLGGTLYRIHGSNEPETIGQAVSSGCFRMTNDDVKDLYDRVAIGTTVIVR